MPQIYSDKFEEILRGIPDLSDKERQYVEDVFKRAIKGVLNKSELIREIYRLKSNRDDPVNNYELNKIKKEVLKHLK